ncbi:MAG: STAS domain-containing protein [Oscillospiraceae bacterium]|nr:STAS domain-containing protein [Oscillospiraceae bacterium]
MTIERQTSEKLTTLIVNGRLDADTHMSLQNEIVELMNDGKDLILDISGVVYVSSAGLRVFIDSHKKAQAAGILFSIKGPSDSIREIFDLTGFSTILNVVD